MSFNRENQELYLVHLNFLIAEVPSPPLTVSTDALFCFMACYEGPGDDGNPLDGNFTRRMNHAQDCKNILDNYTSLDILFMKRFIIDRNFGNM